MLLREAVEDLEWTGGEVEFVMRRSPARFSLQSIKQQSLEVRAWPQRRACVPAGQGSGRACWFLAAAGPGARR